MSNKKIIKPTAKELTMMIQRDIMPTNGAYKKFKSTPSHMDDTYAHVL